MIYWLTFQFFVRVQEKSQDRVGRTRQSIFSVYVYFRLRIYIPSEFKQVLVLLGCKGQSRAEPTTGKDRS